MNGPQKKIPAHRQYNHVQSTGSSKLNRRWIFILRLLLLASTLSILVSVTQEHSMVKAFFSKAGGALLSLCAFQHVQAQAESSSANVVTGETGAGTNPTQTTATVATATVGGKTVTYSPQFTPPGSIDVGANVLPNIQDPEAVDAQKVCPGYKATNLERTTSGFTAALSLAGSPCNAYGNDIQDLILTVDYQTVERLSVNIKPAHITAANSSHYILPAEVVRLPPCGESEEAAESSDLQLSWTNEPSFSFTIIRRSTAEVLFSTAGSKLVYEDQFIEFVTELPMGYNLYGLGEQLHSLRLQDNYTITFWAEDNGNPLDANLYGSHPFYLDTRYYAVDANTGEETLVSNTSSSTGYSANSKYISRSHGVFLRNAHGLEAVLKATSLTWRALGGSIDLYFFAGSSQPEVTSQYQHAIGLPAMQQLWTLGLHQCRWGYKNWTMLQDVVNNFRAADIPLETIWTDIDYMFQYRDFTNDQNTFPYDEGAKFLSSLAATNQHYVPIVDSAIYIPNPANASDNYTIYESGHGQNVFLKNPDGSEYIGAVWPGYTVFPDWLNPNTTKWWTESMQAHYNNVKWSGIWIDMSEVSSFCVGSCGSGNLSLNPSHPPFSLPGEPGQLQVEYPEGFNVTNATEAATAASISSSQAAAASATAAPSSTVPYLKSTVTPGTRNILHPPYTINNDLGDLAVHAVSPNATHLNGEVEYDFHNTFGDSILKATYAALTSVIPGKRPFIIGRSTFAGSGAVAGHWGGDNYAKWSSMYASLQQALQMSLFGIPFFGADLCGFSGNTDIDLCARWMALGSIFPFMRNHNVLEAISQEPYIWADVATATRTAVQSRYRLLPYIYTLLHRAHSQGATVLRALAWEFPNDPSLAAVETQLLLGPAIMAVPVLEPNVDFTRGVFPGVGAGGVWYDWYNHSRVAAGPGENMTISAPRTHFPLFIRGGYVLPQQEAKYTTAESKNSSWSLLVALDGKGKAKGELYVDDGESVKPDATLEVRFTAAAGALYVSATGEYVDKNPLANITVLGVASRPQNVTLDAGQGPACVDFGYDDSIHRLTVGSLANSTTKGAWASDWTLSWAA